MNLTTRERLLDSATRLFADPEFDGDPSIETEQQIADANAKAAEWVKANLAGVTNASVARTLNSYFSGYQLCDVLV